MAKKSLKKKASRKTEKTANVVVDSARDIYLAGLGALSLAREEGSEAVGKAVKQSSNTFEKLVSEGDKLYNKLVKEGDKVESRTRKEVEKKAKNVKSDVEGRVDAVRKQAKTNWNKLESVFEERVARALTSLGVPTSDEINRLTRQVETLSAQVETLSKQEARTAKTVRKVASRPAPKNKQEKELFAVFEALIAENNRDNFTNAGRPTVYAVADRVEFEVDSAKVSAAWENFLGDAAAAA